MDILRKIRTLPTGPVVAVLILGIVFGEHAQPIGVFAWIGLAIITLKSAFSWISRLGKLRFSGPAHSSDMRPAPPFLDEDIPNMNGALDSSDNLSSEDIPRINPTTGLHMNGALDSAGNLYAEDWNRW